MLRRDVYNSVAQHSTIAMSSPSSPSSPFTSIFYFAPSLFILPFPSSLSLLSRFPSRPLKPSRVLMERCKCPSRVLGRFPMSKIKPAGKPFDRHCSSSVVRLTCINVLNADSGRRLKTKIHSTNSFT